MAAKKSMIAMAVTGFLVLVVAFQSFYTVQQTELAIVVQLGRPVSNTAFGPGLHFKIPFIQDVIIFDSRILDYDARSAEVLTRDKKAMVVDNYAKWRIADPLLFYQRVRTIPGAQARLDDIITAAVREALGQYTLIEVVSQKRQEIMDQVTMAAEAALAEYGIEVIDVRIRRTDLPAENERAIFGRMQAERERQAKQYRSEGREAAARITAQADRERAVILAEAQRQSEIIRGEGDAKAAKIYADAFNQSPDFYSFMRSLQAYEQTLQGNTRFVLTPDNPFLQHLQ